MRIYGINPVLISPGNGGAHNWEAMAYSPLTELVYIPGTEGGARYARDPKFVFRKGTQNAGMSTMQRPRDLDGNVIPPDPPDVPVTEPEGAENQPKATGGFLVAWDPKANKERWRVPSRRCDTCDRRQPGVPRFEGLQRGDRREALGSRCQ